MDLDDTLEAGERVLFRKGARPSRLKALSFGAFLAAIVVLGAVLAAGLTEDADLWIGVSGMIGGMIFVPAFCMWMQAEFVITDRRILMGSGVIAWLFGTKPRAISVDPSEIDVITAHDPGTVTIVLVDGRRFFVRVFKRRRQFDQCLKDLLGRPSQWIEITE